MFQRRTVSEPTTNTTQDTGLVVRGLGRSYGDVEAVAGVDLDVPAGQSLALVGPSGCGKTTLLRLIAGLTSADHGSVDIAGQAVTRAGKTIIPTEHRKIGMVFQDWALFPHLTVAKNVGFGVFQSSEVDQRVHEALELVQLLGYENRRVSELSGGQSQRVALARALATKPAVMLFDEAFSSLDAHLKAQVGTEVSALMKKLGITSVYVTHDRDEAFSVGDHVAVMDHGRVLQIASPAELYAAPNSETVARFGGAADVIAGEVADGRAQTALGDVPVADDHTGSRRVLLRPQHLHISSVDSDSSSAGSVGVVDSVAYLGYCTDYTISVGVEKVTCRMLQAPRYDVGHEVAVKYNGPATVTFSAA